MKVLLINPPFSGYGGLEGHGGKSAPLNLGYLASYLRNKQPHHHIEILDAEGLELHFDMIEKEIKARRPDLVGITSPTPAYMQVLEIAKRVKNVGKNIAVVLGGPHPSAFPKECVEEKNVDFAVMGEGEATFLHLVSTLGDGGSLADVHGMAFKENGIVRVNPPRGLIDNLDTIPFPARDLLPTHIYFPPPTKRVSEKKAGNMITSRGCPYDCTYCESKVVWTKRVRLRSPKNVVDEIEECVNRYGIGEFNFHDDIFPMKRSRTIEICREIKRRKLDISWVCMSRVNFVWEDVMTEMKEAGCRKIMFGFESGSQKLLDMMKKQTTIEQAHEAVKVCRKVGIETTGNFMIGNIGETEETIRESIELAKKLNLHTVAFFIACPYPGTDMYKWAKALGYIREDVEWKDFTLVSNNRPPMNLPGLPYERLKCWQSRAYREFYMRPSYILDKIFKLRSVAELKNLLYGAKLFLKVGFSGK